MITEKKLGKYLSREQGPIAGYSETDEQGQFRSFTPANYVVGFGKIREQGRPPLRGRWRGLYFTLKGGSPSSAGFRKSVWAEELACRYRLPLIRFP